MSNMYDSGLLAPWRFAIVSGLFSFVSGAGAILVGKPLKPVFVLPLVCGPIVVVVGIWSWYDEINTAKAATEVNK